MITADIRSISPVLSEEQKQVNIAKNNKFLREEAGGHEFEWLKGLNPDDDVTFRALESISQAVNGTGEELSPEAKGWILKAKRVGEERLAQLSKAHQK